MSDRLRLRLINLFCCLIIFIFAGFWIKQLIYTNINDRAYTGNTKDDGGTISLERSIYVNKALEDILLSRISTVFNEDIRDILNDTSIPEGIKKYFSDFEEFYKYAIAKEKNYSTTLTTETFIKNSAVLGMYFDNDSKEDKLKKASIIPYYFIKNYNSQNKKQKNEKALYKAYIDTFVTGRPSLDISGANVLCLYIYSCYDSAKKETDFVNLKEEIEIFLKDYNTELGENGDLRIQRNYITGAQEILRKKPSGKAFFWFNRLKPYADL